MPAPVGPEEDEELAVGDGEVDPSTAVTVPEALGDAGERDLSHGRAFREARCGAPGPTRRSKIDSRSGRSERPTVSPGRAGMSAGSRAFTGPCSVVTVTICVVPRYSAPNTVPRRRELIVEADVLGPDAECELGLRHVLGELRHGDLGAVDPDAHRAGAEAGAEGQEVHRRRADEIGDEHGGGLVVDLLGRGELLDHAAVHHRDLVGHRHRLELVVGDIDGGRVDAEVQLAELAHHQVAELGVERAERLVHQERLRPPDDGAAERHALAVAAGEPRDRLVEEVVDAEEAAPSPRRAA